MLDASTIAPVTVRNPKPLGRKNYGSIAHLPSSRMGPADHACHPGHQRICCERARDRHDTIIVTEKLDGSNVGIARIGDEIVALGRAGYLASTSKYEQHRMFADWVQARRRLFLDMLWPGHRIVGEWMAQAHGTRYALPKGPFVAFDLMSDEKRLQFDHLRGLCEGYNIPLPRIVHIGGPISIERAMELHGLGDHGCLDEPEGVVYRIERKGKFDFMAKWVKTDKVDGRFLPEVSGLPEVWNWRAT